jgi:hypothetical protein
MVSAEIPGPCPEWVICRHAQLKTACPLTSESGHQSLRPARLLWAIPGKDPGHIEWIGPRAEASEQRTAIDKTMSVAQRIDANMNASIDFKNMPSWVRTNVDDNGVFKNLSVTRSAPQGGKTGSGGYSGGESNPWAYE